jgi:hypothetical protein
MQGGPDNLHRSSSVGNPEAAMNFSGLFRHFPSTFVDGIVGERVSSIPKCPEVESKKQAQAEESHQNKCYQDGALLNSHYVLLLLLRELELLVEDVGVEGDRFIVFRQQPQYQVHGMAFTIELFREPFIDPPENGNLAPASAICAGEFPCGFSYRTLIEIPLCPVEGYAQFLSKMLPSQIDNRRLLHISVDQERCKASRRAAVTLAVNDQDRFSNGFFSSGCVTRLDWWKCTQR